MKLAKRDESRPQLPMNFMDAMNRFFERSFWDPFEAPKLMPMVEVDISEDEKSLAVEASIPGYDPKDIEVFVDENMVTISGKTVEEKEEKEKKYYRRERSVGEFYREIALPHPVDPGKANCKNKNGVLTITMPKLESKSRKRVPVEM